MYPVTGDTGQQVRMYPILPETWLQVHTDLTDDTWQHEYTDVVTDSTCKMSQVIQEHTLSQVIQIHT